MEERKGQAEIRDIYDSTKLQWKNCKSRVEAKKNATIFDVDKVVGLVEKFTTVGGPSVNRACHDFPCEKPSQNSYKLKEKSFDLYYLVAVCIRKSWGIE